MVSPWLVPLVPMSLSITSERLPPPPLVVPPPPLPPPLPPPPPPDGALASSADGPTRLSTSRLLAELDPCEPQLATLIANPPMNVRVRNLRITMLLLESLTCGQQSIAMTWGRVPAEMGKGNGYASRADTLDAP